MEVSDYLHKPGSIMPVRIARRLTDAGYPVTIRAADGRVESFGTEPGLTVVAHGDRGLRALTTLNELRIVDAYLGGDIDLDGDLVAGMDLRTLLDGTSRLTTAWTFLQSALGSRKRMNPGWVAKHYDSHNIQLFGIDDEYQIYTPGLYLSDEDTLEEGAERKLAYAFRALGLGPGASVLDVGCGWGGFARYCARRGVDFTGLSLSRHQLDWAGRRLSDE